MAGLARDLEQTHAARIDRLVDRMAEAGHALVLGEHGGCVLAVRHRVAEDARHAFHRADEHAAEAEEAAGDRRLERLRRPEVGEARDKRTGRDAVLYQGHHHGIEELGLAGRRYAAGELEERHVPKVQVPEDLAGEVFAAHEDPVHRRPGEVRFQRLSRHRPEI